MNLLTALGYAFLMLVSVLSPILAYIIVKTALVHAKYDHLPGPKRTSFLLGHIPDIVKSSRSNEDALTYPKDADGGRLKPLVLDLFNEWTELYGDTIVIYVFYRATLYSKSANLLKTMLANSDQRDFHKCEDIAIRYIYGQRYMGEGLVSAVNHDGWYLRRKALDPMFHRNYLRSAIDAFNSTGDSLITELQGFAESGESFKLNPILHRTTLDVIIRAMFSIEISDLNSEFHQTLSEFVIGSFQALQFSRIPFIEYNPLYYTHRCETRKRLESFRALGASLILERKSAICNGEVVPDDVLSTIVRAHLDFSAGYTFEVMVDEFVTLLTAGMETTANTLGVIFMELGRRPDSVQRLLNEVDEIVGKKSFVSNEDLTKLSFTTSLIKECLRRYPVVPSIFRTVREEVVIDDLRIPAGSEILLGINGSNINEKLLNNPLEFNPDRFDSKQEKKVPMYSFMTFSLGSRNCIGQVFAQMEMKVILAKFFQQFELVLDKSETFEFGQKATTFPISEVKCTLKARL